MQQTTQKTSGLELERSQVDEATRLPQAGGMEPGAIQAPVAGDGSAQATRAAYGGVEGILRKATLSPAGGAIQLMKADGEMEKQGDVPDFFPGLNVVPGAMNMARHHIVPKDTLMNFWNAVRASGHLEKLKGSLTTMVDRSYTPKGGGGYGHQGLYRDLEAYQRSDPAHALATAQDLHDTGSRTKAEVDAEVDNLTGGNAPADMEAATFIEQIYQWCPGNLMIGPRERTDDPANRLEPNAAQAIGQDRYSFLKKIYEKMEGYIADPKMKFLNQLSGSLQALAQLQEPSPYKPAAWEPVGYLNADLPAGRGAGQKDHPANRTWRLKV